MNKPLGAAERVSPLHVATATRHLGIIGDLLRARAKIDTQTQTGNAALHIAIAVQDPAVVFRLLVLGANKLVTNNDGNTAAALLELAKQRAGMHASSNFTRMAKLAMQPLPAAPRSMVMRSDPACLCACVCVCVRACVSVCLCVRVWGVEVGG